MSQTTSSTQLDIPGIAAALKGKIRGQAVAVTLFRDEIHPAYTSSERVDACAILRIARDEDRPVHMNSENHDCSHGSFLTGFDDGNELIASGRLLPVFIPAYTDHAGLVVNSGKFRLPTGSMKGLGAAPLEKVPAGTSGCGLSRRRGDFSSPESTCGLFLTGDGIYDAVLPRHLA